MRRDFDGKHQRYKIYVKIDHDHMPQRYIILNCYNIDEQDVEATKTRMGSEKLRQAHMHHAKVAGKLSSEI